MDTNKMREQFEVAAKEQGLSLVRTHLALRFANGHSRAIGDYIALETLCAWWAWQASREATVVELPTEWRTNVGKMLPTPAVRDAIEAQGLKVIP